MAQFSGGDEAAGVLVKVPEALDKVVGGVDAARLGDGLVDGQEHLEGDALVGLQLVRALEHLRLGRVLAEGAQALAHLVQLDLAVAARVKEVERLLELWNGQEANDEWSGSEMVVVVVIEQCQKEPSTDWKLFLFGGSCMYIILFSM